MSAASWAAVLVATAAINGAWAAQAVGGCVLRLGAEGMQLLQERLISLADERLQPARLSVDRTRPLLCLSGPLPADAEVAVRPLWAADTQLPQLPLTFELRPLDASGRAGMPLLVTLAAPLLREVWVTARRLSKGSSVSCADVSAQRRALPLVPASPLPMPCDLASGAVALHDLAAGAVVRSVDVGQAPDVAAGSLVNVKTQVRGVSVIASATALLDAKIGDHLDVRLEHPARTVRTLVIGPGSVHLTEGKL